VRCADRPHLILLLQGLQGALALLPVPSCQRHAAFQPGAGASCPVWFMACRDNALGPATLAYAQELEESVEALNATLYNASAFAIGPNFEGIIGVATEIVAKKVRTLLLWYVFLFTHGASRGGVALLSSETTAGCLPDPHWLLTTSI
jgi:hypothetical protein